MDTPASRSLPQAPRRWHFELLWPVLRHPRRALPAVVSSTQALWLTPLVLLSALALVQVLVAMPMRQGVAASANVELPPDFQYLTPEQQAQFQASLSASGGPMFTLVFPALAALGRIWFGWLIVAAILHLTMTLFGGRATMGSMLNRAAWAGLPLGVQALIRIAALLITRSLITSPGLSGFAPPGDGWLAALAGQVLGQIDVFMLWTLVLLVLGLRAQDDPGPSKAWTAALITIVLALLLGALPGLAASRLSSMTIVRPFMF